MSTETQQWLELIASEYYRIERERSRAQLLADLLRAKLDGRITEAEYVAAVTKLNGTETR